MNDEDIARSVASELAIEYGPALRDKTEQIILANSPNTLGRPRSFTEAMTVGADLAVIASFIVTMTPHVREKWFGSKSDVAVKASLEDIAKRTPVIDPAIIDQIAEAILKRLRVK
jgi:hypothetical protein